MVETGHDVDGASFGIGAAPNCFFPLLNVEDSSAIQRDYAGITEHRSTSPGIGAFTPWHDRRSHATQNIETGSELFVDYGYGYFEGSRERIFGLIPFLDDFNKADVILEKFTSVAQNLDRNAWRTCVNTNKGIESRQKNCRMSFLEETVAKPLKADVYALARSVLANWPTRTLLALPDDPAIIPTLQENGGTVMKDYERTVRDLDFLQDHGTCMDHLVVRPSTIPVAGRGTFAKRDLPANSTVAPLPLIHLPDRSVLNMYAAGTVMDRETGKLARDVTKPIHQQLLLNYCFGHGESTLLLCPYGVVSSLVNHAPTISLSGDGPTANVKVVWSHKTTAHPEWRDRPIADWAYSYQTGLGFEYVALRDIAAGEEVFVDYGSEWQAAWDAHVANYKPVERLIDTLNGDIDSLLPTEQEWRWSGGGPERKQSSSQPLVLQRLPRTARLA